MSPGLACQAWGYSLIHPTRMNKECNSRSAETLSPSQVQSASIDLLRVPLALMVVFVHMIPRVTCPLDADFELFSGQGFYNTLGVIFSHALPQVAVPAFFFISGYLFFVNFTEWSWAGYRRKMSSRTYTLLIPYLLWNLIPFLLAVFVLLAKAYTHGTSLDDVIGYICEKSWHIFYDCNVWGNDRFNWLGQVVPVAGPLNLPLWFLRDLIVVSILAPVIYFYVRWVKLWGILLLFLAYISRIWTTLPGFDISAFLFFSLGAYFALSGINVVQFANRYKWVHIPLTLVTLVLVTLYDGLCTIPGQRVAPFYAVSCVFTLFFLASHCVTRWHMRANKLLVSSCFFIYALHIMPLPIVKSQLRIVRKFLHAVLPGSGLLDKTMCYVLTPIFAACLSVLLLVILRKLFPKVASLLSGKK